MYISKGTGATVIARDLLSTMIAVEGTPWTKNPKMRRMKKLLHQEKGLVKLMWISSNSGITRNKKADEAVKNMLEKNINCTHHKT
jgi:ribonuclease HI